MQGIYLIGEEDKKEGWKDRGSGSPPHKLEVYATLKGFYLSEMVSLAP